MPKIVNPKTIDCEEDIMELPVLKDFSPEDNLLIPIVKEDGSCSAIGINDLISAIS